MSVSKEEFNKLFKLNPSISERLHSPENCIALLNIIIEKQSSDFEGNIIDFSYISKRWKAYVLEWQRRNKDKDPKYISSKDKLLDFYEYLNTEKYLSGVMEINPEADPRFKLCFGNVTLEELDKGNTAFMNLLNL